MKNNFETWLKLRQKLYRQIRKQVLNRICDEDHSIIDYQNVYEKEFRSGWQISNINDLKADISESQIILVGDFHSSHQSQRTFFRLIRMVPDTETMVIALECLFVESQKYIHKYLENQIDEDEFKRLIKWDKSWGFPWSHYKVIFDWAKDNKIQIIALNTKTENLAKRDRVAAEIITKLVKDDPNAQVFCLYGDYHLAKAHLPQQISLRLKSSSSRRVLRILQNSEKIYFQMAAKKETEADLVKLNKDTYCLMNVPPWVKWQNYLVFLEQTADIELQTDDVDEAIDYTDMVSQYVRIICNDLGIEISTAKLSVYTAQDDIWSVLQEGAQPKEQRILNQLIGDEWSFYYPEKQVAFLARPSVNHAATLAMDYIHAELTQRKKLLMNMPSQFLNLVWQQGVLYFGSKLINHNRKTDTIVDIKSALASKIPSDSGREAMLLTLSQKMKEWISLQNRPQSLSVYQPKRLSSYREAARILGGIMGEKLYAGYSKKHLNKMTLLQWFKTPLEQERFSLFYYEVIEIIDSLPIQFNSKTERL